MSKNKKRSEIRTFLGVSDIERKIWLIFKRKHPSEYQSLRDLDAPGNQHSPFIGTLISVAFESKILSEGWGRDDLLHCFIHAPDATATLLQFVRKERKKLFKSESSAAEMFLRSQHHDAIKCELIRLNKKMKKKILEPTLKEIGEAVGIKHKDIRNANEELSRLRRGVMPKNMKKT